MDDLPIVPEHFKLVVRDERSRKQMSVVTKQIGREDIGDVVNACDAGREGELIFAYLYEKAKGKKPSADCGLNSMTNAAMKDAFTSLRPAEDFARLEQAARSRSEGRLDRRHERHARATIRLRSSFDGAVSLGRVRRRRSRSSLAARGDQSVRARALLAGGRDLRGRGKRIYEVASTRAPSRASPPPRRPRRSCARAEASRA